MQYTLQNDMLKYESFLSAFEGEKGLISNL